MKVELFFLDTKKRKIIKGKGKAIYEGWASKRPYEVWFLNKDGSRSSIIDWGEKRK